MHSIESCPAHAGASRLARCVSRQQILHSSARKDNRKLKKNEIEIMSIINFKLPKINVNQKNYEEDKLVKPRWTVPSKGRARSKSILIIAVREKERVRILDGFSGQSAVSMLLRVLESSTFAEEKVLRAAENARLSRASCAHSSSSSPSGSTRCVRDTCIVFGAPPTAPATPLRTTKAGYTAEGEK